MTLRTAEISAEYNKIIEPPKETSEISVSPSGEIRQFAEIIANELKGVPMKQALGSLMVESLVEIEHTPEYKNDRVKAAEKAKDISTFFEPFYKNEWRTHKSGFLGEVATRLALEEIGFKVKEPTAEEDLYGKIDLWADGGDGKMYAIQIKTSAQLANIGLYKINPEKEGYGVFKGYKKSAESMVKYTAEREEYATSDIVHLILELPGGEGNIDACYNQITGVPGKETTDKILDKFYERIWNE